MIDITGALTTWKGIEAPAPLGKAERIFSREPGKKSENIDLMHMDGDTLALIQLHLMTEPYYNHGVQFITIAVR